MTDKDILKQATVKKLLAHEYTNAQASQILGIKIRQIQYIKVKFQNHQSFQHGLTGKQSNNHTQLELKQIATEFLKDKYFDFGPKFASEQLKKNENITLSPETTRNLMIKQKLWNPKSRKSHKAFQELKPQIQTKPPKKNHPWRSVDLRNIPPLGVTF